MKDQQEERPIPWVHMNQSEKFLNGVFPPPHAHTEKIDDIYIGVIKKTISLWKISLPIHLYYYTSTVPAPVVPDRGLSFIFWNKIRRDSTESRSTTERGYLQMRGFFAQSRPPIAYIDLRSTYMDSYYSRWGGSLKNHRNKWLRNIESAEVEIVSVPLDEFVKEYKESDIKLSLKKFYIKQMHDFKKSYGEDMSTYFVKDKQANIIAGTCILDDKETQQCIYQYAFSNKSPEYKYVGVGIIDFCIRHTLEKGFGFLNLTAVWDKYQPKSWKGLTAFKLQFHPTISDCRLAYFKIYFRLNKSL
jgi:hypothetical protein